jgi:putative phosphonate transport system ATP-binding protein
LILPYGDLFVSKLSAGVILSQRLMVMKDGVIIETGLTDQVLDDPQESYTQLLVSSKLDD